MMGKRRHIAIMLIAVMVAMLLPQAVLGITLPGALPVAHDDAYTASADIPVVPLHANAPGVLANDGGGGLTAVKVADPAHGTLTLSADGSFTYTPTAGFSGADTFTYKAHNAAGDSNTATVTVTVSHAPATHFAITAPASAAAGTPFSITVTALTATDSTAAYTGTVHFTSTDGAAVLPADYTFVPADNGIHTFTNGVTLKTAGSRTITATDTANASITGTSGPITVTGGAATHFSVSAPPTATSGAAFNFTVTAQDQFNNTAAYAGTVHFTSTDGQAALPSDSTLTNGTGTFSATLRTTGNQTITATDTANASIAGTSGPIAVSAGAATRLVVSAPGSATAGTPITVTVTAKDQFNNTVTNYAGTINFTSTDAQATLPANGATLTNGVGTFSATLKSVGGQTITATDTANASITGTSGPIAVSAGAAAHFAVSAPSTATAGTAITVTVTAKDAFNNTATTYAGTVHFTSGDPQAALPADYTFVPADNGVHTFSVTLKTVGNQTVIATDTSNSSITGTSGPITVAPAAVTHLAVGAPGSATAGTPITVTVTAQDQFNNTVTGYTGTVHFTGGGAGAILPADYTFVSADHGTHTFTNGVTLKVAGNQTITATDTANGSIAGTSGTIAVAPGAVASFIVTTNPSGTVNAGTPFDVAVTAKDAYANTVTGYGGTVHFTSTDGAAVLPADYTFQPSDNGVHTFTGGATLNTAGSQTITVADTANAAATGQVTLNVVVPPPHAVNDGPYAVTGGISIGVPAASGVTANDTLNNGATISGFGPDATHQTTVPNGTNAAASANSGTVVLSTDGSFTYDPPSNFTGTDTFVYTLTNGGGSAQATVTLTVSNRVIVVSSASTCTTNCGRLSAPFKDLAGAAGVAALASGHDLIYVESGTYTTGIALKDGQFLVGQGRGLSTAISDAGFTPAANSITTGFPTAGTAPAIVGTVTLGEGNTVEALTVSGPTGAGIAAAGKNAATVTSDVTVQNAGGAALDVSGGNGSISFAATVTNTTQANGQAVKIASRTGGTVSLTGSISDTAGKGVSLTSNAGTVSFTGGLTLSTGANTAFTATGGGTVNVTGTTNTINAASGQAVNINGVAMSMTFSSVTAGGGASGIGIVNATGTFTANGGAISGATTAGVNISLGTANVTYAGTVNSTTGHSVSVTSTTGGTIALSGAISDTGTGIALTSNGATINFSGTLTLSTGANSAFAATGGGTVTATNAASTLATTTGTALNVANTNIGSGGLMFKSISANGATNGIVLNTTGSSGGLSVLGTGSVNSGGTIQNTTSHGISLTSTLSPSFNEMSIQNTGGSGIKGTSVTNFTFTNGTINNSGTGGGNQDSNIAFNTQTVGTENNLSGTVTITGNTFTNALWHGVSIFNFNGTISGATISNNTITSSNAATGSLGSGIQLVAFGSATTVANVTKATIDTNIISNFPSGTGIVAQAGNSNAAGTGSIFGTPGSGTNIIAITNNRIAGFSQADPMANNAILTAITGANTGSRGQANFNISNNGTVANPLTNVKGNVISPNTFGYADSTYTINNNVIVANNTATLAPGIGGGLGCASCTGAETPDMTATIIGNNISQTQGNGILMVARDVTGSSIVGGHLTTGLRVTIQGNTVAAPLDAGGEDGIRVDSGNGSAGSNPSVCLSISGNNSHGSPTFSGIGVRKQGTDAASNIFGIAGLSPSPANQSQVVSFIQSHNPSSTAEVISGDNFVSCTLP